MQFFGKNKEKNNKRDKETSQSADKVVFGAPAQLIPNSQQVQVAAPPLAEAAPISAASALAQQPLSPVAAAKAGSVSPQERTPSAGASTLFAQPAQQPTDELRILDISGLEGVQAGDASGSMLNQRYVVGKYEGGRSKVGLPVHGGEIFVLETYVRLEKPATTKNGSYFLAGCLFLDASGNILQWWDAHSLPDTDGRPLVVKAVAPASAGSVKIGLHGTWNADGTADDAVISYGPTTLRRVKV